MNLCYLIASKLYKRKVKKTRVSAKSDSSQEYWDWQFKDSKRLFGLYPNFDVKNKTVLEIGCGIGGRSCYVVSMGAKKVVGIDVNHSEINIANQLVGESFKENQDKIEFIKTSEDARELNNEMFDVVLFIDAIEHVVSPDEIISLAYSKTKPGGCCYFSSLGWYHKHGAHMHGILPIPFINVFFSEKQILGAAKKLLKQDFYVSCMHDSDPPIKRWEDVHDLKDRPEEYLNKITIQGMRKVITNSPFEKGKLFVHGVAKNKLLLKPLDLFAKVPFVQEMFHSYCVGKLDK